MKITKNQIRKIIKEELNKVLNEANRDDRLSESVLTKKKKYFTKIEGVYLTTGDAFLRAVRDMAAIAQETGNLEQALEQLEANVDAGKYTPEELHKALRRGLIITGGVYATSGDSLLAAMTDAGEAALEGMSPDEVAAKIEANVDAGKYDDPRVRDILASLASTGQPFNIGRYGG